MATKTLPLVVRSPSRHRSVKVLRVCWLLLCLSLALHAATLPYTHNLQLELLVIYYQPLLPQLLLLWLWAVAVGVWQRLRIDYGECFPASEHTFLLSSGHISEIALYVTTAISVSGWLFCVGTLAHWEQLSAAQPPILYLWLLCLLIMPLGGALYAHTRLFFGRTLWKIVLPLKSVGWADFLLADMLTSLSKPLSDMERAICHMSTAPILEPLSVASGGRNNGMCANASPIIPLFLATPYVWRLLQCLRSYQETGALHNLANAAKYSTAFPVIFLSHLKYHTTHDSWRAVWQPAWLLASLLNTSFSIYWDTERDWGIPWLAAGHVLPSPGVKHSRLYGHPRLYSLALVANAFLRVSWTYKLSSHLRHNRLTALLVCFGEVIRRFQWSFFRIETELLKLSRVKQQADADCGDGSGSGRGRGRGGLGSSHGSSPSQLEAENLPRQLMHEA